jgi:hypothetical protein
MSIGKFFKGVGKAVTNVAKVILPAPVKVGMAVVDKLTGNKGGPDPEAVRQAEEDRKFTEEMNAQTEQINAQTAQMQAENEKMFGMLGNMRSESALMFQEAMGGPSPGTALPGLPVDFEGKDLFDRYSGPQSFDFPQGSGFAQPFAFPQQFGAPQGFDIAQALRQYGLDLNKLQMT